MGRYEKGGDKIIRAKWYFDVITKSRPPKCEVCIVGSLVYTMNRRPLKAGRTETESYIGSEYRNGIIHMQWREVGSPFTCEMFPRGCVN